jgi:hypothetical protein
MKVHDTTHQRMLEMQQAALVRTHKEQHYAKIVEDATRLCKQNADSLQQAKIERDRRLERRTERNRRLENSNGQNIDIDC